ncbi:hypothetical protein CCP4SC76_1410008 [Gammaproteobacteria bacterium]
MPSNACQRLVSKVCGLHDTCATLESCRAARQLLALEQQDAQRTGLPIGERGSPCDEALLRENFFQICDNSRTP